jgi:hypothetical protein
MGNLDIYVKDYPNIFFQPIIDNIDINTTLAWKPIKDLRVVGWNMQK